MRIVYMGSPDYAATILQKLLEHHEVVGVFTNPDKVRSRGNKLMPTPVKTVAETAGVPVFTPRTLRDSEVVAQLKALAPEVICVAAYGKILPAEVLEAAPLGCVNVHASLLPRWRGAAPIQRAVLAGDALQGVSIMKMEIGLDTGDYCLQAQLDPAGLTTAQLTERLACLGGDLLVEALDALAAGTVQWTPQDEALVTYANKIERHELNISAEDSAVQALAKVLASDEAHPAKAVIAGKTVALEGAVASEQAVPAGEAKLVAGNLVMGFGDGALAISQVKPEGRASMPGKAFAAGVQGIKAGVAWSAVEEVQ